MERQAGLGRSLRDVIESLTPVEPEIAERVQFDATELVARLDDLLVDVRELRDRVHHLVEFVGDDAPPEASAKQKKSKKKGKKNRAKGKK